MYLRIYDLNKKLIEKEVFIYRYYLQSLFFETKKSSIYKVSTKEVNNKKYFKYYKMILHKLLEYGVIEVGLISRINKRREDKGKYRNLVFQVTKIKFINHLIRYMKLILIEL